VIMPTAQDDVLGIADLLADDISSMRALRVGYQLTDAGQRLLSIIQERVACDDCDSLRALSTGSYAAHKMLGETSRLTRVPELTGEPFKRNDGATAHAARGLAALGLALTAGAAEASDQLRVFRRWIACSGLEVPGEPVRRLPATIDTPHAAVLRHLAGAGELDLLSLVWMAELDGWPRGRRGGLVRLGPSTQVLLDRGQDGQRPVLSLTRVPGLPSGLVPDPATMTLSSADPAFQSSLSTAWQASGGSSRGAVLWSLADQDGPVVRVTNESLSLAFTVLLDEQRRLSRPMLGPLTVRRLRPRTAIVGRIAPEDPDLVSSVSGYDAKLGAVGENTRVILPRTDLRVAIQANRKYGDRAQLVPVETWRRAAKAARSTDRRRQLALATVVLLVVAATAVGLYGRSESKRDADQRRAIAADLAARAVTLRQTDPMLAAKLGLAAHEIDPMNGRAIDALRDVLGDHHNVLRTWRADPSRVDSLTVSQSADRVTTSGSDGVTKVWSLSSGAFTGKIPRHSFQMVSADSQAMVAADTGDGLVLYDIGGDQPAELGRLPAATCTTTKDDVATIQFSHNDTTLVAVWKDGAISTYDTVTRRQTHCLRWQAVLAPLTFAEPLPVAKVVAADIVAPENLTASAGNSDDEVVLVLTTNDIIATGTNGRDARIEIPSDKITGDASLVAASPETVGVATALGVTVWNRRDHSLLANPAGGLGLRPRVLVDAHGHLLFSGETGTAVLPIGKPTWLMPDSLTRLSGGAATVAAISDRSIVAGGPGGRISIIADSSGELALPQDTTVTATAYQPDGRLLAAEIPANSDGKSAGTYSSGLMLIDPRTAQPKNATDAPRTRWTYGDRAQLFYVNAVAATSDLIAAAGQVNGSGMVLVWQRDEHTTPRMLVLPPPNEDKLPGQERIIASIGFTPDGSLLVARHVSGQVGMWSTKDWKQLGVIDLKPGNTRMRVLSGRAVFLAGAPDAAELVDVDLTTRQVARRTTAPGAVFLSVSADGHRAVTMTEDGTVQTRGADLAPQGDSWRPVASGDPVTDIALAGDSRLLAIAQGDRVLIYDLETKTLAMPPLDADGNRVVRLAWSPDGRLLTGSTMPPVRGMKQANRLRVWKTGALDWTSQVCRWAGGGLTQAEWSGYVGPAVPFIDLCAEAGQ